MRRTRFDIDQLSLFDNYSDLSGKHVSSPASARITRKSSINPSRNIAVRKTVMVAELPPQDNQATRVVVPVSINFDACQALREAIFGCLKSPESSTVIFDCRHLELSTEYVSGAMDFFDPAESYVLRRGGLLNISVFINLLRCYATLTRWSNRTHGETGIKPIENILFLPPNLKTGVGKLWEVLNLEGLLEQPAQNRCLSGVMEFQSRYITPLLLINEGNRNQVLSYFTTWVDEVERLGDDTRFELLQAVPEIAKNLVEHSFKKQGILGASIWPTGQVEIAWSNRLDPSQDWSSENALGELVGKLINSYGAGMPYILKKLIPDYTGVLVVNLKTHHFIFRSGGDFEVIGLRPRSKDFTPDSILFNLHLFCRETRQRSLYNDNY